MQVHKLLWKHNGRPQVVFDSHVLLLLCIIVSLLAVDCLEDAMNRSLRLVHGWF